MPIRNAYFLRGKTKIVLCCVSCGFSIQKNTFWGNIFLQMCHPNILKGVKAELSSPQLHRWAGRYWQADVMQHLQRHHLLAPHSLQDLLNLLWKKARAAHCLSMLSQSRQDTLCESGRCIDALKKRGRVLKKRGRVLKKRGRVLKKRGEGS